MHTQLYRYLRENSGGIDNRCYITGMFGPFEMDIQQIIRGWYFVTCPGLRIHNQALTLDTAHKICSRFKRRLTYELNRVNGKVYTATGISTNALANPEYSCTRNTTIKRSS